GRPPRAVDPPAAPLPPLTSNQRDVGRAIDNFFNNGGTLPPTFVSLYGLSGSNLTTALDQLSGEAATGAQKVAFQLTDQFLNVMLDPFVDGRSGVGGADHPALGFAPERETMPPDIAHAYASVLKAPPAPAPVYEPRWTAWAGASGASTRTTAALAVGGTMISPRARSASPPASIIASRPIRWRVSPSPAAAPIGAWRRGWAAARAMPSRPASTARPAGVRPI